MGVKHLSDILHSGGFVILVEVVKCWRYYIPDWFYRPRWSNTVQFNSLVNV